MTTKTSWERMLGNGYTIREDIEEMKRLITELSSRVKDLEGSCRTDKEWLYNENELYSDLEKGEIHPEGPSEPFIEDMEKVTGKHLMTYTETDMIIAAHETILKGNVRQRS
ncbi:hypothetical protein Tco_0270618 [Tanacetum coccineum]